MVFPLQFQLQLCIFIFQLSYSYSYCFSVSISIIAFFTCSYSFLNEICISVWRENSITTLVLTVALHCTLLRKIQLKLNTKRALCFISRIMSLVQLWQSMPDSVADLFIIFQVHFQHDSSLEAFSWPISVACCQLQTDWKHTFNVCLRCRNWQRVLGKWSHDIISVYLSIYIQSSM